MSALHDPSEWLNEYDRLQMPQPYTLECFFTLLLRA